MLLKNVNQIQNILEKSEGKMKIQELNDYIYNYLKNDKTNTAIMLTGEWGAGKSHYIKRELMTFFYV